MPSSPTNSIDHALSRDEIESFVERGYLLLRGCFSPEAAAEVVEAVRAGRTPGLRVGRRTGAGYAPVDVDLREPSTWGGGRLDVETGLSLSIERFAPRLWGAIQSLVGVENTIVRRTMGEQWIVHAPSSDGRPSRALRRGWVERCGWHIDAVSERSTIEPRFDALTLLILWTDVEPGGSATLFSGRSLDRVVHLLEAHPEGIDTREYGWAKELIRECDDVEELTGRAGDVLVAHSLSLHAAPPDAPPVVRILENPTIAVARALRYSAGEPGASAVERAVLRRRRTRARPTARDVGAGRSSAERLEPAAPRPSAPRDRVRTPQVVAIDPVPPAVEALVGRSIDRAAAWATDDAGVFLRGSTANGERFLLQWSDGPGGALRCRVVTPDGRARAASLSRLDPPLRRGAERFVARVRWIAGLEERDGASEHYTESAREARYARAYALLARIRAPEDASRVEWESSDPELRGVALYLDVLAGRWQRVFAATDAPKWLQPALLALRGDVEGVRELAASAPWRGAGALANVAGMAFQRVRLHEAAEAAYAEGVEAVLGVERADLCLELSKLSRARGDDGAAVTWARRALLGRAPTDDVLRRASVELVRAGALDDAHVVLRDRCERAPIDADAALALAELLVWADRGAEARAWLDRAAGCRDVPRRLRCEGAVLALEERWAEAAAIFERADALSPGDMEINAWLAEVHLRAGDHERAARCLAQSRAGEQNAVHVVLTALVHGTDLSELAALLDALEPGRAIAADRDAALELLRSFGGNRGEILTRTRRDARDGLGLARVPQGVALSSRDASAAVLRRVGTVPLSTLEAELEALAERHRSSPHPLCYWGELALWWGRYDRALELFERALSRERARWGYVGKAAVMFLRGDHAAAEREIAECARWFPPVFGATTDVYVGEAHRRRGELPSAVAHLERAVRAKPGRAGAWMNLALAHLALDQAHAAERIFDRLAARFPGLYADAWVACAGEPAWPLPRASMPDLFEKALELMRGNRSSHTITYFDAAGRFRVAADVEKWQGPLASAARFVAVDLRSRLASGIEP